VRRTARLLVATPLVVATACTSDGKVAAPTSGAATTARATAPATATTGRPVASPSTTTTMSGTSTTVTAPSTSAPVATAGGTGAVIDPGDGGAYDPPIDPAEFSATITNPWFPLTPGERWVYESSSSDGEQRITVEVLADPSTVMGVPVVQVHDVVTEAGATVEDTIDHYSQRADGSVWYLGEATTAYEHGRADTAGSWQAGVAGALPGIIMAAHPTPDQRGYRQEFSPGQAEDMGRVIATDGAADVPAGHFQGLVVTVDWSPLEPDVIEEKYYASGVGVVQELTTHGGDEVTRLVEHHAG
jgi:hypothetical protein